MAKANREARDLPREPDVAVSEVISYVFMLALGAIALTISMSVLTETQEDGRDIALSIQMKQAGQIVVAHLQETARVATLSPNASYNMILEIPDPVAGRSYNATVTPVETDPKPPCEARNLTITSITDLGKVAVNVSLGNAGQTEVGNRCLFAAGLAFDGSSPRWRVQYENRTAPQITIHPHR